MTFLAFWKIERFKGNAGVLVDTHPGRDDLQKVMLIGHADKIRMQVRHISKDGKIWIDSDSFLPGTLLGNEVKIFSRDFENNPSRNNSHDTGNSIDNFEFDNKYKCIHNGTVEAHGARAQDHRAGPRAERFRVGCPPVL